MQPVPARNLKSKLKQFLISSLSLIAGITLAVFVQAILGSVFDNLITR